MSSVSSVRLLLSFFLLTLVLAVPVFGRRSIPADNLAYPVLIVLDNKESASGFYLSTKTHIYLVTARHVLIEQNRAKRKLARCLSYPKDPNDPNNILLELDLHSLEKKGFVDCHKTIDAVIVRIAVKKSGEGSRIQLVKGVRRVKASAQSEIVCVSYSNTKRFDEVLVSNDIFIFGYPSSIGIKEMPQLDHLRPLLRKGIVAGKNRAKRTIIIDCPTYYGNSGGPVMQAEQVSLTQTKFAVIGFVSEYVPFKETWLNVTHKLSHWEVSNSGYSIVIPIDAVLELLPEEETKRESNVRSSGN